MTHKIKHNNFELRHKVANERRIYRRVHHARVNGEVANRGRRSRAARELGADQIYLEFSTLVRLWAVYELPIICVVGIRGCCCERGHP